MIDCPYCQHEFDDPDECNEPGIAYESGCPECEKNFVFYVDYTKDFYTERADCLNGAPHDFRKFFTTAPELNRVRCSMCHMEKTQASAPDGAKEG